LDRDDLRIGMTWASEAGIESLGRCAEDTTIRFRPGRWLKSGTGLLAPAGCSYREPDSHGRQV
jgi:hypothetical protein